MITRAVSITCFPCRSIHPCFQIAVIENNRYLEGPTHYFTNKGCRGISAEGEPERLFRLLKREYESRTAQLNNVPQDRVDQILRDAAEEVTRHVLQYEQTPDGEGPTATFGRNHKRFHPTGAQGAACANCGYPCSVDPGEGYVICPRCTAETKVDKNSLIQL